MDNQPRLFFFFLPYRVLELEEIEKNEIYLLSYVDKCDAMIKDFQT